MELINILIKSMFVDNMALVFFLGMCSFLAVSKKVETAMGLGLAVTFVLEPISTKVNAADMTRAGCNWLVIARAEQMPSTCKVIGLLIWSGSSRIFLFNLSTTRPPSVQQEMGHNPALRTTIAAYRRPHGR